jgi:hypothetical protein
MTDNEKAAAAKADEPEKHTVEALIEGAQAWTGYSPHLVAGALSGQSKKTLTIEETVKLTKRFAEKDIVLSSAEAEETSE